MISTLMLRIRVFKDVRRQRVSPIFSRSLIGHHRLHRDFHSRTNLLHLRQQMRREIPVIHSFVYIPCAKWGARGGHEVRVTTMTRIKRRINPSLLLRHRPTQPYLGTRHQLAHELPVAVVLHECQSITHCHTSCAVSTATRDILLAPGPTTPPRTWNDGST